MYECVCVLGGVLPTHSLSSASFRKQGLHALQGVEEELALDEYDDVSQPLASVIPTLPHHHPNTIHVNTPGLTHKPHR